MSSSGIAALAASYPCHDVVFMWCTLCSYRVCNRTRSTRTDLLNVVPKLLDAGLVDVLKLWRNAFIVKVAVFAPATPSTTMQKEREREVGISLCARSGIDPPRGDWFDEYRGKQRQVSSDLIQIHVIFS